MGGKTSQSTSSTTIPPAVLAQYQAVNQAATQTAQTPFQTYGTLGTSTSSAYAPGTTGTFVAPINTQQQTGIAATNASANEAQPYYSAATGTLGNAQAGTTPVNQAAEGLTAASAGAVNASPLTSQAINQYLSPYLSDVVGSEAALLNQNNQQQQSGALGTAISSGAFGGDRTGLAAANLEQQQNLANANIYSGLLNTGYNTALSTAQQQQGVNLAAAQANRTALQTAGNQLASIGSTAYGEGANTASELGALGTGAQTAGLQGASAQLSAGTLEQQTQQAQDTAQYNQFEQQQSYPFQVDQFLANIAEGTGALSGSTTTTTEPGGFFSDERLKEDKRPIGKTYDGQTIYSYKVKGDPRTRIGLMAQEVEDKHPKAVGLAGGFKTVDYKKATDKAANEGHFYRGGVVPIRKAGGGSLDPADYNSILASQQQMYSGLGAGNRATSGSPHGGTANVPAPMGLAGQLHAPSGNTHQQPSGLQNLSSLVSTAGNAQKIYNAIPSHSSAPTQADQDTATAMLPNTQAMIAADPQVQALGSAGLGTAASGAPDWAFKRGGLVGYADGGGLNIPDDPPTARLPTTPSPQPPKTGLAALESDINQIAPIVQFASQFDAGGRVHMDAGGDPDADALAQGPPQPTDLPAIDVTSTRPAGLASAATTDQTPTAPTGNSDTSTASKTAGESWWDRNKGNLLPALQGLAAMGTAPTRHLGVALAAGLGAGAESYVPTQEGLAKAGLTQAQATGAGLQNQITAQKLKYLTEPPPTVAAPNTPAASPNAGASPPTLPDRLRAQYQVPPITAQDASDLQYAHRQALLFNSEQPVQAVRDRIKARVEAQTYQNQQDAQGKYDAAVLTYQNSNDPYVKKQAAAIADAYHPWTGDQSEVKGDVLLNSRTTQPLIGAEAQRLSPEQLLNKFFKEYSTVDYGANLKPAFTKWAKDTYGVDVSNWTPSIESPAPGPAQPGRPIAAAPALSPSSGTGTVPPTAATARLPATSSTAPVAAPTSGAPSTPTVRSSKQDFTDAPNKPSYIGNPAAVLSDDQKRLSDKYAEKESALLAEANSLEATQQQYVQAQRMLKLLPSAKTGPGTETMSAIQTALENMTGAQFTTWLDSNPSAHALLAKSLGNNALETTLNHLRTSGAEIRLGAQSENVIINKLSASPEMPKTAIRSLLNWQLEQNKYDTARELAIPDYLAQGKNAMEFDNYYSHKFPLQNVLTTNAPEGTSLTKPMPNEARLKAYANAHSEFGGDVEKAKSYLKSQGYR